MQFTTKKSAARQRWLRCAVGAVAAASWAAAAQAQTLFLDDFGSSTERTTSPYVPQMYLPAQGMDDSNQIFTHGNRFYKFAQPYNPSTSTSEQHRSNDIENGYYAVANPDVFIKDATVTWDPGKANYWFKVPASGGDFSGEAQGATPGSHGAVLAVNAGMVRNEYYRRSVDLERGSTYELSAAFYIVNSGASSRFEVQRSASGEILAKSADFGDWYSPPNEVKPKTWTVMRMQFTIPLGCGADENYSIALRNLIKSNSNNDFYVDDIQLTKLSSAPAGAIAMACPTTAAPSITAQNDGTWTVYAGEASTDSVRENDSMKLADGSSPALTSSNTTITQTSTVAGVTLRDDGYIEVASTTPPGTYEVPYQICIAPATKPWPTCSDAVATVVVPSGSAPVRTPELTATPDDYTGTPTAPGGKTPSVITNDSSNDGSTTTTLTPTDIGSSVTVKLVGEDPGQFTMNPDGSITVGTSVPPGNYTLTYEVCAEPAQTPANCKTTTVTILVQMPIDAVDDDFSAAPTEPGKSTPSVLSNDTLNGAGNPTPNTDVIVRPDTVTPPPAGFTVNPDGTIAVDSSVPPGDYSVSYKICASSNTDLCDTAVAKITVANPVPTTPPTILATDDDFTGAPTVPGSSTSSILGNDTFNSVGNPSPVTDVEFKAIPDVTVPAGFTIQADGTIAVDASVTPGSYDVPYQICVRGYSPAQCSTAVAKIKVSNTVGSATPAPTILANIDDFSSTPVEAGKPTPSVLSNDQLNGVSNPSVGTGGVTVVPDPNKPKVTGFTVNPDGTITVDPSVTPGNYEVPYQICSVSTTTQVCSENIAKITVTTPNSGGTTPAIGVPVANDDDFSSTPVAPGGKTPTVVSNDDADGKTTTAVPGTNVTVELGDNPPAGFSINPDGTINVPTGLPAGDYTVPYKLCVLPATTPATCDEANAKITVTSPNTGGGTTPAIAVPVATDDDFTSTPVAPGGKTPTVVSNDDADGKTTTAVPGTNVTVELGDNPPAGFSINPDGTINVPTGLPAGDYTVPYKLCVLPATTPATCDEANAKITVSAMTPGGGENGGENGGLPPLTSPANVQPVPGLQTWSLALLSLLLGAAAVRRRSRG
ncbi:IPTL-CTERM sorting domain-containing protein [Comamonas sp. J-3]|uniref:IPTL-CTERM sorting domain-containing protein n=1 Tax=Comamonas trifloxystrobinivorans TaxID=3350256 RepID=UPI00372CAB36